VIPLCWNVHDERAEVKAAMGFDWRGWIENVDASLVEPPDAGDRLRRRAFYVALAAIAAFAVWLLAQAYLA
jgi:hypothetical protein